MLTYVPGGFVGGVGGFGGATGAQMTLDAALSLTVDVPPNVTRAEAPRFSMALWMVGGAHPGVVMNRGAANRPASAAPARVSGKFSPVARKSVLVEPGGKYASLIAAVVAYQSEPPKRVVV